MTEVQDHSTPTVVIPSDQELKDKEEQLKKEQRKKEENDEKIRKAEEEALGIDIPSLISTLGSVRTSYKKETPNVWSINCQMVVIEFVELILQMSHPYLQLSNDHRKSIVKSLKTNKLNLVQENPDILKSVNQIILVLRKMDKALMYNEKGFVSYMNQFLKDSCKNLWLPEKGDFLDIDSNGLSNRMMLNSWFSIKQTVRSTDFLQKTSPLFYRSLLADEITEESDPLMRSKKIKLSLTPVQKEILKVWVDHSRYSYNRAVSILNVLGGNVSKTSLRDFIVPAKVCNHRCPWVLDTPKPVREGAVFEAHKNRKAGMTNLIRGNIQTFSLNFISKKKESWTLNGLNSVRRVNNREFTMYPTFGLGEFKTKENLPLPTQEELIIPEEGTPYPSLSSYKNLCSMHFDGCNYYLCVPIEKSPEKIVKPSFTLSCDPGVRTMHTCYVPDMETCFKIGDGASNKLFELDEEVEKFKVKAREAKTKQYRRFFKMRIIKNRAKIQYLQSELHWKTARWMCLNFRHIVIPRFGSTSMVCRETSKLSADNKRRMFLLAHGKFLSRLMSKAEEFGTTVQIVDERNTTRTCSHCDYVKNDIGKAEEWTCNNCKFRHDRDCTASRNIFQKQFKKKYLGVRELPPIA